MVGLLGLPAFEACNSTIDDLGEERGHRVLRVAGKGANSPSSRLLQRWPGVRPGRG
jgi:hypothetical protein